MIKKENQLLVIVSLVLVFTLFLALLSGAVFQEQIKASKKALNPGNSNTISIDWEKRYPYDTTVDEIKISNNLQKTSPRVLDNITSKAAELASLGSDWSKFIINYDEISKLGYIITSKLTDLSIGNTYVKLKNGYWTRVDSSKLSLDDAKAQLASYASLNKYLSKKNIKFLYCFTPDRECALDNEFPHGIVSYRNQNIDIYLQALNQYRIDNIDMRQLLHRDKLDHYSLFYKTDHHWNINAAMWATSTIEKEIRNHYGIAIPNVYNLGSYKRITYKNAMFGSAGQSVTHYVEKSENFDILYPKFATNFKLEIPDKGIATTGAFEEIFFDCENLQSDINKGGGYVYERILYGTRPYVKITNLNNPSGTKILIIGDSYAIAVAPYLALSCSELVLIDTRPTNGNFTGSIVNCINNFSPDIVISLQAKPQSLTLNKKH